jgi:hypothetical protein
VNWSTRKKSVVDKFVDTGGCHVGDHAAQFS